MTLNEINHFPVIIRLLYISVEIFKYDIWDILGGKNRTKAVTNRLIIEQTGSIEYIQDSS